MPVRNLATVFRKSIPLCLLTVFALICYFSQKHKSVTVDEFCHFPSGIYNLITLDWRMDCETPPLVKCLPAITALISKPELGIQRMVENPNPWSYGYDFMFRNSDRYQQIFGLGRCVVIVLACIGGWILYRFAYEIHGYTGGLFTLLLYVFNPNIVAHSRLTTIDAGATCTILLSVYCFWKFIRRTGWLWSVIAGAALGIAQLSKFTALLMYPVFIAIFAILCLKKLLWPDDQGNLDNKRALIRDMGYFLLMLMVSLIAINAGYLFVGSFEPLGEYRFASEPLRWLSSFLWGKLPVPVPRDYLAGFDLQLAISGGNNPFYAGYLMGQHSSSGWWYYYVVAFFVKNPVALSIIALFTAYVWTRNRKDWPETETVLCIWLPVAGFFVYFSFLTNIPIGIRFTLPAFPFLFLSAGYLFSAHVTKVKALRIIIFILTIFYMAPIGSVFPNYLSYFNSAVGGPNEGYKWLIDSNLDWGQDLPALKQYMEEKKITKISLGYFGRVDPGIYGIHYELAQKEPRKGIYAISINYLVGRPYYLLKESKKELVYADVNYFDKYRSLKPVDVVAHTMHIFSLDDGEL